MIRITAPLGELAEITSGFAFKSEDFNSDGNGLPLVRIRDVVDGTSDTYFAGEYKPDFVVNDGDALIGMDGQFNLARWQGGKALLNQRVCKVKASSKTLDQAYLLHFLPAALKEIEDRTPFVTVKHLSVKSLREIKVPLPHVSEQRRIAAILDKADVLRAKRREAIAKLDQLLQSVFFDMFGSQRDPKFPLVDLVGRVKINPPSPVNCGGDQPVPFLPMAAIDAAADQAIEKELRPYSSVNKGFTGFQRGDVLLAKITPCFENGKIAIANISESLGFGSTEFHVLRPGNTSYGKFLVTYLRQAWIREVGAGQMTGSAGQRRVPKKFLEGLKIPDAPSSTIRSFATKYDAVRALRLSANESMSKTNDVIGSLQQKAFSGAL